ncbi:MAG: ferrous iron transport protein B [Nitrospinae bacterium]|nr:ferrous iron transport protein B [Nitrospinota bacterium]
MHDHQHKSSETLNGSSTVVLLGNPNVGKSVIFGLLTGKYVDVSNYPGTTVEISKGIMPFSGNDNEVLIDSPGINSLIPMSEDERITRDILFDKAHRGVIQVIDAKNLRRGLFITLQLAEAGIPIILVLNIYDEATERGIYIDRKKLGDILGIKIIPMVATERMGLPELKRYIHNFQKPSIPISFNEKIENAIREISYLLPETKISKRGVSLMLLSGDETLIAKLKMLLPDLDLNRIKSIREENQKNFNEPLSYVIQKERLVTVEKIYNQCVKSEGGVAALFRTKIGNLSMHPLWGIPILLSVLYFMYKFVGEFGAGEVVDFMEETIFGTYINPWITALIDRVLPIQIVREAIVGEYGIITMGLTYSISIVLPIVSFFFIFFGILEDSGYLPRLTVMSNKLFKKIGLSGKAVLPMVLGLGCDTMATFTVRILETRKERIIATMLLALGIPCSAQLGVVMGMLGGISERALIVVICTVLIQLIIVGYLSSKIIPGRSSDFFMELPPIRIPKLSNILRKTYYRVKWFLKEAVPLFIIGTFILFASDKVGLLRFIERVTSPVVTGILGLPDKATWAFIVGFLRRDYGAAGLFYLQKNNQLDLIQTTIGVAVMILFVPCLANFLVIIKEQGWKWATIIVSFIFSYAVFVGWILNLLLHRIRIL